MENVWLAPRSGRSTLEKESPVPTGNEAGWALDPVWTRKGKENLFAPAGKKLVIQLIS